LFPTTLVSILLLLHQAGLYAERRVKGLRRTVLYDVHI